MGINTQNLSKIYVFGNEYLEQDSMARKVSEYLDHVQVIHCRSPEELLETTGDILILDVVQGAQKPILITDTSKIKTRSLVSLHDLDLGYFLNLMDALGEPKTVKIIGVPEYGDPIEFAEEVNQWL